MAFPVTLGELVATCQQLANQPTGGPLTPAEWKSHISARYGRIHTMVSDTGARYFETEATVNLANLALPTDHKSSIGVDLVLDTAGHRHELPELMIQERNWFRGASGPAQAWSLSATSLQLFPTPTTGTYKHLYVPQPTRYNTATDSTSVDVLTSDGLDAITWGVASIALHRSESAQQRAMGEAESALGRLKEWAVMRSMSMPKRQSITDVRMLISGRGLNGAWNPASWIWNR